MTYSQEHPIRRDRHCISALHVHWVFITKYRRKVFHDEIRIRLEQILRKVCNDFDVERKEFNGEKNHVHLLFEYPPQVQLSKLINSLKGVSSRLLRQEFSVIHRYLWKGGDWSPNYFAGSCKGANLEVLTRYIESQNRPDSFLLLRSHGLHPPH